MTLPTFDADKAPEFDRDDHDDDDFDDEQEDDSESIYLQRTYLWNFTKNFRN